MALEKVTYVDGVTIIGAKNLNDIQDELIRQGEQQTEDEESMATALALKADKETTYTKTEVDTALALKADKSDTYTKAQVDASLALKADKSDTYTKAEVDASLELKADKSDTYTKAVVDGMVQDAIAEAVRESEYSNFEMKSVSGDFIHITDGAGLIPVKDLKIGIDAVQDLHGYDAPWVGGAGKNVLPLTVENLKAENTAGTWNGNAYTLNDVTFTLQTDAANNVIGINVNGTASAVPTFYLVRKDANLASLLDGKSVALNGSPDGSSQATYGMQGYRVVNQSSHVYNEATFTFNAEVNSYFFAIYVASGQTVNNKVFKPMLRLASVTDDSFAPYSNICPINGRTGARITVQQGVNQWDEEWEVGSYSAITGEKVNANTLRCKNKIKVFPNTEYFFEIPNTTGVSMNIICFYDENENFIRATFAQDGGTARTTPNNCYYATFAMNSTYGTTYNHDISINYPSTETDYHAYDGQTYEVTWQTEAGTVYGGTLDVTTGMLTVDRKMYSIETDITYTHPSDWKTGAWYFIPTNNSDMKSISGFTTKADAISNFAPVDTPSNIASLSKQDTAFGIGNERRIFVYLGAEYDTQEKIKQVLSDANACYVAPLSTPQTYQLTPTEVLTLLGENNIFADTGAVEELIYRISRQ